jgi:hypothetical protein
VHGVDDQVADAERQARVPERPRDRQRDDEEAAQTRSKNSSRVDTRMMGSSSGTGSPEETDSVIPGAY